MMSSMTRTELEQLADEHIGQHEGEHCSCLVCECGCCLLCDCRCEKPDVGLSQDWYDCDGEDMLESAIEYDRGGCWHVDCECGAREQEDCCCCPTCWTPQGDERIATNGCEDEQGCGINRFMIKEAMKQATEIMREEDEKKCVCNKGSQKTTPHICPTARFVAGPPYKTGIKTGNKTI